MTYYYYIKLDGKLHRKHFIKPEHAIEFVNKLKARGYEFKDCEIVERTPRKRIVNTILGPMIEEY